ncbi:MAG: hypothetical protein AABY32_05335 [Nanoarchaeota archaeon]
MSLIDKFEEAFFEEFSKSDIDNIDNYAKQNHEASLFLFKFKEGFKEKIEEALGEKIINKVRENYYPKLLRGVNSGSLPFPEYLAYALQQNSFSFDELYKINLWNDSWRIDFIIRYSDKNLLKNLREKLLPSSK